MHTTHTYIRRRINKKNTVANKCQISAFLWNWLWCYFLSLIQTKLHPKTFPMKLFIYQLKLLITTVNDFVWIISIVCLFEPNRIWWNDNALPIRFFFIFTIYCSYCCCCGSVYSFICLLASFLYFVNINVNTFTNDSFILVKRVHH